MTGRVGKLVWDDPRVRVATWNLERADPDGPAGEAQRQAVDGIGADVWIFTEAHAGMVGPTDALGAEMPGTGSARLVTIRAGALAQLPLPEAPTAAAALVTVDARMWLVVGVCMPWRAGAPALPPDAAPGARTGPEQWRAVLARLDAGVTRLRDEHPDVPLLVGGDFNQTLEGAVVGSREGRAALAGFARRHGLQTYTSTAPSAIGGCRAIDHLFGERPAAAHGTLPPPPVPGRRRPASDHAAHWADVTA